MIEHKQIFSQMIANPQLAESFQETLSDICVAYPWFVIPKVIRLALCSDLNKKKTLVESISLNLYASSYYSLQSAAVATDYTRQYLFVEKKTEEQEEQTVVPSDQEMAEGVVLYEAQWSKEELFPKGRIVVTKSGLFYSEETEGYKIIKEVIAVNQKIDENGNKISIDKTAEIIDLFLSKKIDKVIPQVADIKEGSVDLSVVETDEIITESMAKIYRMQGLNNEAISIYNKLILKNPEKSRYFAEIISSIRSEEDKKLEK